MDLLRRAVHRLGQAVRSRAVRDRFRRGGQIRAGAERVEHGAVSAARARDDILPQRHHAQPLRSLVREKVGRSLETKTKVRYWAAALAAFNCQSLLFSVNTTWICRSASARRYPACQYLILSSSQPKRSIRFSGEMTSSRSIV